MNLALACHEGYLYPRDGHWSHSKEWKENYSHPVFSSSAPSTGAGHSTVWSIESSANLNNCDSMTTYNFIDHQSDTIAEEAARGQGLHLEALAQLLGCNPISHKIFGRILREEYGRLASDFEKDPSLLWNRLKTMVHEHPSLREQCVLPAEPA
jgi:hypothetical protein